MALAVETHPQHAEILDWIGEGLDCTAIAARLQPKLDPSTIWRFKRKRVAPFAQGNAAVVKTLADNGLLRQDIGAEQAMQAVLQASVGQLAAEPILARIAKHQATADSFIAKADSGRDAAALINADLKGLELTARLTGLLDGPSTQAAVTNNFFIAMSAPPQPAQPGPVVDALPSK